jgi:beta-galactosidase
MNTISPKDYEKALAAYRALNDSPMQRRLREEKRWFAGVVYWKPGDYDAAQLKNEFRRIREMGFNVVRFHSAEPEELEGGGYDFTRTDNWMNAALESGLQVAHPCHPGKPSDRLLARHGITPEAYKASWLDDSASLAVLEEIVAAFVSRYRSHPALFCWGAGGEPGFGGYGLKLDYDQRRFGEWLKEKYGTLEELDHAWALYPEKGKPVVSSFEEAWKYVPDPGDKPGFDDILPFSARKYGPVRDMLRYQTEKTLARAQVLTRLIRKYDSDHPIIIGSHQMLLNQAYFRWDSGQWARIADLHFSSIHLAWHFELVKGEVDRPVYMTARLTRDYFKDGWTSAYETTGGAVQFDGYGNAITPGLMRRLVLSYLAAGNVNVAFWTWNHRPGGWEAGEYGMTSFSGALTSWAEETGKIVRAMNQYHEELWEARHQVKVGLVQCWDNEAIYLQEAERHDMLGMPGRFANGVKNLPPRAYIGLARALINHKIPYEYVTTQELLEGIALYYPVLYLPHLRAVPQAVMEVLIEYVKRGGRLVADVQVAFENEHGIMHPAGAGGLQERAFGAYIDMIHDTRTNPISLNGFSIDGFYGDLVPTNARVLARFDNGQPAVTETQLGRGSAVLIGFDAARMCFEPGNTAVEAWLASLSMGNDRLEWECDAPMAFRLSAPGADHYFLLNDGVARAALLKVFDRVYASGEYVIEERPIDLNGTISVDLPARSAVWLRFKIKK